MLEALGEARVIRRDAMIFDDRIHDQTELDPFGGLFFEWRVGQVEGALGLRPVHAHLPHQPVLEVMDFPMDEAMRHLQFMQRTQLIKHLLLGQATQLGIQLTLHVGPHVLAHRLHRTIIDAKCLDELLINYR